MRIINSKKGITQQFVVGLIIAMLIILMFFLTIPLVAKDTSNSIINTVKGIIGEKTDEVNRADLYLGNPELEETATATLPPVSTSTGASTSTSVASPLTGSIAERAVVASKEAGLDRAGAEIILKLISQESQFRHCCQTTGNVRSGNCKATEEVACTPEKILTSFDGTSLGVMQLNIKAHPVWYTTDESQYCSDIKYKSDCRIKQLAGCYGKTAYDLDCNLRIGIRLLMANKNQFGSGKDFPEIFLNTRKKCGAGVEANICQNPPKHYTGWDAALRAYVGWCCDQPHYTYVEGVNKQSIDKFKGVLDKVYG